MIQAVDRALRILTVLQGGRRMSLGEIAGAIDLAPSTVHGLVRTLLAHGMVAQELDSARYRLGPATLRLGNVYLDTLELRSRVAIWAEGLARRTGCAVRTGVLLFDEVVVVAHEPRPDGTRQMPEVGIVIPAHASALGKALLAFGSEFKADELGEHKIELIGNSAALGPLSARSSILVSDLNREYYSAAQNSDLLKRISAETGGKYYTPSQAQSLLDDLTYRQTPYSERVTKDLWDMPINFMLIVGLLSAEWFLRKREGLA